MQGKDVSKLTAMFEKKISDNKPAPNTARQSVNKNPFGAKNEPVKNEPVKRESITNSKQ